MQWSHFDDALLYLILCSFVVERALAVLYETEFYIRNFSYYENVKPGFAIIFATIFAGFLDVNLYELLSDGKSASYDWSDPRNLVVVTFTGLFLAGGSKPSMKLFRDVMGIQSSAEKHRRNEAISIPKNPADTVVKAASGDKIARKLIDDMLDNALS